MQLYVSVSNEKDLAPYVEKNLQDPRPAGTVEREPFHWPLVFPEIFADTLTPGFDAIIGNPPFLGGKKISGTYGDDYLDWLQRWDGNDVKGQCRSRRLDSYCAPDRLLSVEASSAMVTQKHAHGGRSASRRHGAGHQWKHYRLVLHGHRTHGQRRAQICQSSNSGPVVPRPSQQRRLLCLDGEEVPAIGPDLQALRPGERTSRIDFMRMTRSVSTVQTSWGSVSRLAPTTKGRIDRSRSAQSQISQSHI